MSYTDKIAVISFDLKTADMAAAPGDNVDLFSIIIPANRETEIQGMRADVRLASDGADFIELVKSDNTVISKIALVSTGQKSGVNSDGTTATTFPQRIAPQSTTVASVLKLRTDGALDATTDVTVQIHISGLMAQ